MMYTWEQNVRRVTPYTPGEQPRLSDVIKLNTNENPYPPAPGVEKALRELDSAELRKYPDPTADELVSAIARRYHLPKEQVFVGVGSDDVLAMSFLTFFNGKEPILFPDITYSFYDVWAEAFRIPFETVPLDENFEIRPEDYERPCGGVIFPNPNAPTGALLPLESVRRILDAHRDVAVIVDEAYIDFGGESVVSLLDQYDNLLVVQTYSKSRSMAGIRIGFAFGSAKMIRYLNDFKYSFNSYTMNLPSIKAGAASMEDEAYFKEQVDKIIATRERVKVRLAQLGFTFKDSKSNFLFVTHPMLNAAEVFAELKEAHIFVRYFTAPRIKDYLRITIGTDTEMDKLIAFLERRLKDL